LAERDGKAFTFALDIDMVSAEDAPSGWLSAKRLLSRLGVQQPDGPSRSNEAKSLSAGPQILREGFAMYFFGITILINLQG
jgi:hypothetical protein